MACKRSWVRIPLAPFHIFLINVLWTVRFFAQDGEPVEPFPKFPVTPFIISPNNSDIIGLMDTLILGFFARIFYALNGAFSLTHYCYMPIMLGDKWMNRIQLLEVQY